MVAVDIPHVANPCVAVTEPWMEETFCFRKLPCCENLGRKFALMVALLSMPILAYHGPLWLRISPKRSRRQRHRRKSADEN